MLSKKYIQKMADQFDKITDFYNNCALFSSDLVRDLMETCSESLHNFSLAGSETQSMMSQHTTATDLIGRLFPKDVFEAGDFHYLEQNNIPVPPLGWPNQSQS
jgi:hypothetical protein